jgi:hypothetical protein
MNVSIYAPHAKERLKQRVNIQFCILNKSSATLTSVFLPVCQRSAEVAMDGRAMFVVAGVRGVEQYLYPWIFQPERASTGGEGKKEV